MPGRRLGAVSIGARYLGATSITRRYLGTTLVWSRSSLRDDFNRPDGALGANWTDEGPSVDHKAAVVNGQCRLEIVDGLIPVTLRTSRYRFNAATAPNDDYDLEFRVGSKGSGDNVLGDKHWTRVFARVSNTGFTHGVGVHLLNSQLAIVRRVASVDTLVVPDCGAFAAGDAIRMRGAGNLHTLILNGEPVGEWNDSGGTALSTSGYRSLGLEVRASRDYRRLFSPSIDYVDLR